MIKISELHKNENFDHYVFDIDGTLNEFISPRNDLKYTDEDKADPYKFFGGRELSHIGKELAKNDNIDWRNVWILGVSDKGHSIDAKVEWLKKHFQKIRLTNVFFVDHREDKKTFFEKTFRVGWDGYDYKKVLFVDDTHETLYEVENLGISARHVSSME